MLAASSPPPATQHRAHPAGADCDPLDLRPGGDRHAGLAGGVAKMARDLAHAAADEAPGRPAEGARGVLVQQAVGGPRRRRPRQRVRDRVPAERGADVLGMKPLLEVLAGGGGEQLRGREQRAARPAGTAAERCPRTAAEPSRSARRHAVEPRREQPRRPLELALEARERRAVATVEARQLACGRGALGVEAEPGAVAKHVQRRTGLEQLEAASAQPEVAPDRRAQEAEHVRPG